MGRSIRPDVLVNVFHHCGASVLMHPGRMKNVEGLYMPGIGSLPILDKLFLTMVGGGAFGNKSAWIEAAILRSLREFRNVPLNVEIVSYGSSDPRVQRLLSDFAR